MADEITCVASGSARSGDVLVAEARAAFRPPKSEIGDVPVAAPYDLPEPTRKPDEKSPADEGGAG
jgi:hypothetical protein